MDTCGRSILGLLIAGALATASCSGGAKPEGSESQSQVSGRSTASPSSWLPHEGKPAERVATKLAKAWLSKWPQTVRPFKSNADDDEIVGSVFGAEFSGVALVDTATGDITARIDPFANADSYQATGEANDRFAVWKELPSLAGSDEFNVKVWDRKADRVSRIGGNRKADDGHAFPSSWQAPVLSGDKAAWVEGTDDQGTGELILQDLDSGKKTVISSAHPGWLAMYEDSLIWAESPSEGALTQLHAVDVNTLNSVDLPPALKDLTGAAFLVTDGKAAAWVQIREAGASLVVAPNLNRPGVTVSEVANDGFSPPILMTPAVIASSISGGGLVVLDRKTGSFAVLKDVYGAEAAGSTLLVSGLNKQKELRPTTARAILTASDAVDIELD